MLETLSFYLTRRLEKLRNSQTLRKLKTRIKTWFIVYWLYRIGGMSHRTDRRTPWRKRKAQKLGLDIVRFMRDRADQYAKEYELNFTLLATPAEGLSGRFVGIDRSIYGKIEGVTDRDYYTNSFHVPVHYDISVDKNFK